MRGALSLVTLLFSLTAASAAENQVATPAVASAIIALIQSNDDASSAASRRLEKVLRTSDGRAELAVHKIVYVRTLFFNVVQESVLIGMVLTRMNSPDDLKAAQDGFGVSAAHVVGIADTSVAQIDKNIADLRSADAAAEAIQIRTVIAQLGNVYRPYAMTAPK